MSPPPLLSIRALTVRFGDGPGAAQAVREVDLDVAAGEIVGIVGESGSGKTSLCMAIARGLPRVARVGGSIMLAGRDLLRLGDTELRDVRRRELAMILQNPQSALDPMFTLGSQIGEVLGTRGIPRAEREARALGLLQRVHIPAPGERLRQYPHELSGGMKQRVLTAMATASDPRLLLADEPTSALDASVQEEVLVLFREIRDRSGTAVVLVSHDLGAIRRVTDRTVVMYAGRMVEAGPTRAVFGQPAHPYTRGLVDSVPRLAGDAVTLAAIPGSVPDVRSPDAGCAFLPRCSRAGTACRDRVPPLRAVAGDRVVACVDPVP